MKALLFLIASLGFAQPFNPGVKYDTVDPMGACTSRSTMVWNYANGKLWACKTGTWTNVTGNGMGMGCIPSSTAGKILVDDGAGGCTSTTPTISGSTITASLTGTASGNPPNARAINTTSPITGGGDLSADRTIACATCVTSAASLTSNLPVIGAGSQASAVGTRSGNTTQFVTTTGTQTSGDCVKIDANGNHVANGSACGSGSGGLTLVEEHSASGSAALNFTTCISGTYDTYYITFTNVIPATNNVDLELQVSTDGGATYDTGSNYPYYRTIWIIGNSSTFTDTSGSATAILLSPAGANTSNASTDGMSGHLTLFSPGSAALHKWFVGQTTAEDSSTNYRMATNSGLYNSATAVNAFRLLASTGNLASGTVRCYGLAK